MCLEYINYEIRTEEHFQHIRWKAFRERHGALFPIWFNPDTTGNKLKYTIGALHFFKPMYGEPGMYAFVTKMDCEFYISSLFNGTGARPVLMADIVQTGQWTLKMRSVVAKICYLLTDEEYQYLISEHHPIQLNEDNYEIPVLEEI